MGILGLTHDERGEALEKFPVTIKVAIGEGPDPDVEDSSPRALFHFVFKKKTIRGGSVCWAAAPEIAETFGDRPTELGIIFLHDDPREVFPSEYALWTRRGRFCHGELIQIGDGASACYKMQAIRRTREHPEGELWPADRKYLEGPYAGQPVAGCGVGCPELESGNCGPSGDLYFILEKFPHLGAICRLHTGGKTSVPNLSNAVAQLHHWNNGRLKWVKAMLKVRPEVRWHPTDDGRWETSIVPILTLEIGGTTLEALIANMNEPANTLQCMNGFEGNVRPGPYLIRELEAERAPEIADEFYPQNRNMTEEENGTKIKSSKGDPVTTDAVSLARQLGYGEARINKLLRWTGKKSV